MNNKWVVNISLANLHNSFGFGLFSNNWHLSLGLWKLFNVFVLSFTFF